MDTSKETPVPATPPETPAVPPVEETATPKVPARKRGAAKAVETEAEAGGGAALYAAYFKAAGGKNHLNEPLPASYADLTEDRQTVWDATAAAF